MPKSFRITESSPLRYDANCVYCHVDLELNELVTVCGTCRSPHHVDCWQANGNHCATFGCAGNGRIGRSNGNRRRNSVSTQPSTRSSVSVAVPRGSWDFLPSIIALSAIGLFVLFLAAPSLFMTEPAPIRTVIVERGEPERVVFESENAREIPVSKTLQGYANNMRSIAISADGRNIVSGSINGTLSLWDVESGELVNTLVDNSNGTDESVLSVAMSPDGKQIVAGYWPRGAKVWDRESGELIYPLRGYNGGVYSVGFSPNGKQIISSGAYGQIRVWDVTRGWMLFKPRDLDDTAIIWSVAFSPDGERIVAGGSNGFLRVWAVENREVTTRFLGHTGVVRSVAFSPDGEQVASGGEDATVRLWDAVTATEEMQFAGHTGVVRTIAFSPDGKQIALGGVDNSIRLWDLSTGRALLQLADDNVAMDTWSLAFSPDGRQIVSVADDSIVRIWELE